MLCLCTRREALRASERPAPSFRNEPKQPASSVVTADCRLPTSAPASAAAEDALQASSSKPTLNLGDRTDHRGFACAPSVRPCVGCTDLHGVGYTRHHTTPTTIGCLSLDLDRASGGASVFFSFLQAAGLGSVWMSPQTSVANRPVLSRYTKHPQVDRTATVRE